MAAAEGPQRCLYEILGIELTATADEIRAAYRKLALKLHPDKAVQGGVSQEEATARFQEILRAYEVLSDPRERSWYDSHRSQILYSSASSSSAKKCDFDINLWPFFCTSVYSGYGDTGKGFFRVYGDIFQTLFQQEIAYSHSMGAGPVPEAPLIGNLKSPYAQVSAFYNYWMGFSTVKDFTWVDEYRISAGPNRKTRRLMEEENKKLRKKAKREYNETVRQLAEFVKKRDKRVLERQLQRKKEEEEKAVQAKLRREKLEKEKLARARQYEEQEWARVDEGEEVEEDGNLGAHDGWYDHDVKGKKGSDSGQPGGNRELYCVVCSKKFKSDKQWKNHEQSKKHRDRVIELRDMFEEDSLLDALVEGVNEGLDSDSPVQGTSQDTRVDEDSIVAELDDLGINKGSNLGAQPDTFEDDSLDFEEDNKTSKNRVAREFSVLEKTEEFEGSQTGVEHFDDLHDVSDNESYKNTVEDEEEEIENNTEVNSGDEEHENDDSDMDDEASLLEAMLKTLSAKRGANNVYRDTARTEADGTDYNYRGNDEESSSTNQRSRHSNKVEPTPVLAQPDTDDGTQNDMGISRSAQRQGYKNTVKQKKKQPAGADKNLATYIVKEVELRSEDISGDRQLGTESPFHVDKQADELEVDKEKGRLPKPAKQSVEKKSASANTSANDISAKVKKQVKGKKGKGVAKSTGNLCETCGENFDSRNQLFRHISGTGHAMLKAS